MVTEEARIDGDGLVHDGRWCYLVSLAGRLYALPDDSRTVLLPFITGMPVVTPLPAGLVPPYVLGLINVAQRGELVVDLCRLLDLRSGPPSPAIVESQRVVVVGEASPPETDEYRLAFAIDYGYELLQNPALAEGGNEVNDPYVRALIETPRGTAALLDLETLCNAVLREMGAERQWNDAAEARDEGEP
ncbi:MAG: chemotaxis protein CheW [Chloroflexota bacterium]